MYQVISFDYAGSSNVSIHCLTPHISRANFSYDSVIELNQAENRIVELVQIEDDYFSAEGFTLYWGAPNEGIKVIRSTNRGAQEQSSPEQQESRKEDKTTIALEQKISTFVSALEDIRPIERDQVFYIITTPTWASYKKFEIGACKDESALEGRLANHNMSRPEDDLFYYVRTFRRDDFQTLDDKLKGLWCQFLDRNLDAVYLQHNRLRTVVEHLAQDLEQEIKQDIEKETSLFLQNNRQEIQKKIQEHPRKEATSPSKLYPDTELPSSSPSNLDSESEQQ